MFKIKGTVLGTKTVQLNGQNGPYERYFVGFQAPRVGGFEGEMETKEIQVSKAQYGNGIFAKYERIKGQEVEADVFPTAYTRRDNSADIQWFLSGNGEPRATK